MIQTKVARVVSPTELVLAAGADDGVEEGMEFVVYSLSDAIRDPDTGEDLGQIEIVKARVVAAHVQDRMTVVRTKSRVLPAHLPLAGSLPFASFTDSFLSRFHTVQEEMKVENAQGLNLDSVVRVGDLVRTVTKPVPVAKPELVVK